MVHLFMNGGPSHVDTFDPKPMLDRLQRQAGAGESAHRAQDRRGDGVSVQVQEVWPERHRGQRPVRPHGRNDRRDLRDPLDARRRAQSRALADADELRRGAAGAAEPRLVGAVRTGHREPEPARLHRHVPGRLPDRRVAELAVSLSAGRLPGNLHRQQAHRDRQADREHPQPWRRAQGPASPARPAGRAQPAASRTGSGDEAELEARIQSFELAYRMQSEAADAFDISQEPEIDPRDVRPGRARPAASGDPAAARARGAVRAALARRRPALGQSRRPGDRPPPARPGSATGRSPRSSRT